MFKDIQAEVDKLEKLIQESTGKKLSAYGKLSMLTAEVGELADEVIALEGDRVEDKEYDLKDDLAKEIVDVTVNAMIIANHYGIDLDEYFTPRVDKIKKKF
jgi:NTP pyrophosphatase (non-canonical NTP hydrolase)